MTKKIYSPDPLFLTEKKIEEIKQELADLELIHLPEIRKRLSLAYEDGDIPENNPWLTANDDLQLAFKKRNALRRLLQRAKLYKQPKKNVALGKNFLVKIVGKSPTVITLVSSEEADPVLQKISIDSPLGQCLRTVNKPGTYSFESPAGTQTIEILQEIA